MSSYLSGIIGEIYDISEVVYEIVGHTSSYLAGQLMNRGELVQAKRHLSRWVTWEDWKRWARKVDQLRGRDTWKRNDASELYDYKLLRRRMKLIRRLRESRKEMKLVHNLRSGLLRSIGGQLNAALYENTLADTKYLIQNYQKEVCKSLDVIRTSDTLTRQQKLEFFAESHHAYGKSALLLSGGAQLALYHSGVVKVLYEQNLLPRIIAGSSAGAIIASFVATHTNEEIPKLFERGYIKGQPFEKWNWEAIKTKISRFLTKGVFLDNQLVKEWVRGIYGDVTFQEAYDRTGFILNITVSVWGGHEKSRLLNYLTSPNVVIWSAVIASCAIPYIFDPVELVAKDHNGCFVQYQPTGLKYVDGSIGGDLPMARISELFNVNAFIVSQVNPHVVPFLSNIDGNSDWGDTFYYKAYYQIKSILRMEIKHRVAQLRFLNIFPSLNEILGLIEQDYKGHVTIFPIPSCKDFIKIIANHTEDDIVEKTKISAINTFPKISMIKSILQVEKKFEECYTSLWRANTIISATNSNTTTNYVPQLRLHGLVSRQEYLAKMGDVPLLHGFEEPILDSLDSVD